MKRVSLITLFIISTIVTNAGDFLISPAFKYQTINNSGSPVEVTSGEYIGRLYSDYDETMNAQASHIGIVIKLDGIDRGMMQIQATYINNNIVAGIYQGDELIAFSDSVFIEGNTIIELSSDRDKDGLLDYKEAKINLKTDSNDSDNDGYLDNEEIGDIDNPRDSDNDHIIDALDLDSDNDGMSDKDEKKYGFNPIDNSDASIDSDGDGMSNINEIEAGTNPKDENDYPKSNMSNQEKALFTILLNRSNQLNKDNNDIIINVPALFMIEALKKSK